MKVSQQDNQSITVSQQGNVQQVGVSQLGETLDIPVSTDVKFLKGADGFSPTIDVEKTEGGHNVTVTDAEGSETFFVQSGSQVTDEQVNAAVSAYLTEHPISIEIADTVTEGDMRPVSSNAVYVEMGNINALLKTI